MLTPAATPARPEAAAIAPAAARHATLVAPGARPAAHVTVVTAAAPAVAAPAVHGRAEDERALGLHLQPRPLDLHALAEQRLHMRSKEISARMSNETDSHCLVHAVPATLPLDSTGRPT